jgi:hypothetical protein
MLFKVDFPIANVVIVTVQLGTSQHFKTLGGYYSL